MPEANIIFVNIEVYFSQWQNQRVYFSQLQNLRPYLLYIISGEKYFWTQKSLSGGMLGFKHRTTSHQKKKVVIGETWKFNCLYSGLNILVLPPKTCLICFMFFIDFESRKMFD